jgi:hypothetical protein
VAIIIVRMKRTSGAELTKEDVRVGEIVQTVGIEGF